MARRLTAATAQVASIPAPVGGLNDRDSIASMPATDAVILENWWLNPSKLVTRSGSVSWATGFASAVETLIDYAPPSGSTKLFAASAGKIYDVTSSGAIGAAVVSGLTSNKWQDTSISTAGGSFQYLFNGQDDPRLYDGSSWQAVNAGSTPIAITGVTTNLLTQGNVYQDRLWMVEKNSLRAWYLPVKSVGGAAAKWDLGAIFQRGGSLVGMYTWTLDAGNGQDDHAAFVSSQGEVAVYRGGDPTTAGGFVLIGVYYIGRPVGQRPCVKYGGDLLIITETGVYPMSSGLLTATIDRVAAITDKIQNTISSLITAYETQFGWELCLYPTNNALVLNVPMSSSQSIQYVQNTISKQWTKFTGWNATTFKDSKLGFFFADGNSVKKAWIGNTDSGAMILCDSLQAFSYFGSPVQNKMFTMVKPYLRTLGNPSVLYGLNGDFNPQDVTGVLSYTPPSVGMIWNSMVWGTMVWGGSYRQLSNWNTTGLIAKSAALRMKLQNNACATEWAATDFVYSNGGIL